MADISLARHRYRVDERLSALVEVFADMAHVLCTDLPEVLHAIKADTALLSSIVHGAQLKSGLWRKVM